MHLLSLSLSLSLFQKVSPQLPNSLTTHHSPLTTHHSLISLFFIVSHLRTLHQNPTFINSNLITYTMSLAPSSYASLYSSTPLPRTVPMRQSSFCKLPCSNHSSIPTGSISFCNSHLVKPSILVVRASETESSQTSKSESEEEEYEEYEVELVQPYGLRFAKGRDGGTYIDAIAPGGSADKSNMFTVGDKVLATSAVFGTEIWPAAEYGRTMYTIRQRIGPLLMKMQKRYGKMDNTGELTEKEIIRAERNSGVISNRVREIQMQNYQRKMEQKERRAKDLREGLQLYRSAKYEEALEKFESVLGSKPDPNEASAASYNVACCYSKLNQIQAGLSALEDALEAGYEDFKTIRTDPDLANIRKSEEFEPLLKRFDESFINENAINAIKSLFGLLKKE